MSESNEVKSEAPSKYEVFGGWLRFFQVINIIPVALFAIVVIGAIASTFFISFTHQESIDFIAVLIESLPRVLLSIIVVRVITKREERVPDLIKRNLVYYLALTLLAYIVIYFYYKSGVVSEKPSTFLGDLIYFYGCKLYFERSKRVAIYYGKNAT